jgi:hypothetical protein
LVNEFERGRLAVDSFVRCNRLFTIEQSVVLYAAGKINDAKLHEVKAKIRQLFS